LNGGFIQFWTDMMEWEWSDSGTPARMPYPVDWGALVRSMREIGMKMIVIQQTEYAENGDNDPTRLYKVSDTSPTTPRRDDATEKILTEADPDMTVFMGLVDVPPSEWDKTVKASPVELDTYLLDEKKGLATKNIAAADRIWALYHRHSSFNGWYIPLEMWNFSFPDNNQEDKNKKVQSMRRFWKKVTNHLATLDQRDNKKRDVAIATYFNSTLIDAKATEKLYTDLLKDVGIKILMLQDGVGARSPVDWEKLREYYIGFRNACGKNNVTFWTDTELYESRMIPADIERLKKQLQVESEFTVTAIGWDYYQYMNPVVPDCCFDDQGQIECKEPAQQSVICQNKDLHNIINTSAKDRRTLFESYKKLISSSTRSVLKNRGE